MKYISLHIAVYHPLIAVNQSLKGVLRSGICRILGPSSINLQLENVIGTSQDS
jgi:hypothetical protein